MAIEQAAGIMQNVVGLGTAPVGWFTGTVEASRGKEPKRVLEVEDKLMFLNAPFISGSFLFAVLQAVLLSRSTI